MSTSSESRRFPTGMRRTAWEAQDGRCSWCRESLGHSPDADHIRPWARGNATEVANLQLLHEQCHVTKSRIYDPLRDWQADCLDRFRAHRRQTFLVQADVGSGKTIAGISAFDVWRIGRRRPLGIFLAPSIEILRGWAEEAVQRGVTGVVNLDARERTIEANGREYELLSIRTGPAEDDLFLLLTYQSLDGMSGILNRVCRSRDTFVCLDEVHHVESSDEAVWGASAEYAFTHAERILALSATPFRSNRTAISFLDYGVDGIAIPDYEFSKAESIDAGFTIPVNFVHRDARAEWTYITLEDDGAANGAGESGLISDRATADRALSSALEDIEFCLNTIQVAEQTLAYYRETHYRPAKGLIVARDVATARQIHTAMNEIEPGIADLAVSDLPDAHATIKNFRTNRSQARWLVAVGMVSEGCNIPDLSILVYLTPKRTRIAFSQLVGRIVRSVGVPMDATVILPDHPVLSEMARDFLRLQPIATREEEGDEEEVAAGDGAGDSLRVTLGVDEIRTSAVTSESERVPVEERARRTSEEARVPIAETLRVMRALGMADEPQPGEPRVEEIPALDEHSEKQALREEANQAVRRLVRRSPEIPAANTWVQARERAGLDSKPLDQRTVAELRRLVRALHQMGGA